MSQLSLTIATDGEGNTVLKSPGVGYWRGSPRIGTSLIGGQSAGVLAILGRDHELFVPKGVQGVVVQTPSGSSGDAIAFGDALIVLGDAGTELGASCASGGAGASPTKDGVLVFCSSSSGRFYLRPAPEKPAFVSEGDIIEPGHTVFLLEVMKTFSRVSYGGEGLPERAKVVRIVPKDGDDLEAGQVVLELEAAD